MSNYRVTADALSWRLERLIPARKKPNGELSKERWVVSGHYSTPRALLAALLNARLRDAVEDVESLRDSLRRLDTAVRDALDSCRELAEGLENCRPAKGMKPLLVNSKSVERKPLKRKPLKTLRRKAGP